MNHVSRIFLVVVLVGSPVIGLVTPYLVGLLGVALLVISAFTRRLPANYDHMAARVYLATFVGLGLAFAATAEAPGDLLYALNFSMLLYFGPFMRLIPARAGRPSPLEVSQLAALGTLAALVAILPSLLRNDPRLVGLNLGPIVLSNCALALSAVALTGLFHSADRLQRFRSFLWFAPVLAALTALLTGSRGPLIALAPFVLIVAVASLKARHVSTARILAAALVTALLAGALLFLPLRGEASIAQQLQRLVSGFALSDPSATARLSLYQAGFRAFMDAPLLGHGWVDLMSSIRPYLPEEHLDYARRLKHLHNDILNFAVAGGLVGVLAYFCILFTPLVAAIRSTRDEWYDARVFGTTALATVYFFAGLTDLMFGQEFHTMLFVVLNSTVLTVYRQGPPLSR